MQEIYRQGTLTVWVKYDDAGRLAIDAQDLGGHPAFEEYEYFIRIGPDHFSELRPALGGGVEDDVLDLILTNAAAICRAGETSWLEAHAIPYDFSTWGH